MRKHRKANRFISALLGLVMCLSLIPTNIVPASAAAESTVVFGGEYTPSLKKYPTTFDPWKSTYNGMVYIHLLYLTTNGTNQPAFCMEKGVRQPDEGATMTLSWEKESRDPSISGYAWLLDWFYNDFYTGAFDLDANVGMASWTAQTASAVVQAGVWLHQTSEYMHVTPDMDCTQDEWINQVMPLVNERVALLQAFGYENAAAEESLTLFQQIWNHWKEGGYGYRTYAYYFGDGQDMLTVSDVVLDPYTGWIELNKVDSEGNPLAGAEFTVYLDEACTQVAQKPNEAGTATITTDSSGKGSVQVEWKTGRKDITLWVKESKVPSGDGKDYVLLKKKWSVAVNADSNDTEANAAKVNGGVSIENVENPPPEGVLRKVDAATGQGIGPATFHFEGNGESGQHYSFDVDCDENGVVELQWNKKDEEHYIEPGEYTVTETRAPEGYEITDSAGQHLKLWLDYWEETGDYDLPMQSGPLIFEDYKKHEISILKVSADGVPLPGAVFEIYKNGVLLTSVTTGPDGTATFSGMNGNGLESGAYLLKETVPPSGFMLPTNPERTVYIDTTDKDYTEHQVTAINYKWSEIQIEKVETGTERPLSGAVFEVKIDGAIIGTFKTDPTGKITITQDKYGDFWNAGLGEHVVEVREITAPEGYLLTNDDWQSAKLIEGQKLATFVFSDTAYPEISIVKYENGTTTLLPGATFEVKVDDRVIGEFQTGANGRIEINFANNGDFLKMGDIKDLDRSSWNIQVREKVAPDGYLIDDADWHSAQLVLGEKLQPFVFTDTPYPEILIEKYDNGMTTPLPGATFEVYIDDQKVGEYQTNDQGQILIDYETYGKFLKNGDDRDLDRDSWNVRVRETVPPDGYLLDDESWHSAQLVRGEKRLTFTFTDTPYPTIIIEKYDNGKTTLLDGATFEVRIDDQELGEFQTKDGGRIEITYEQYKKFLNTGDDKDLDRDSWNIQVRETVAPDGYLIDDPNWHGAQLVSGKALQPFVFTDTPYPDIEILKIDRETKEPLPGTSFNVQINGVDIGGPYITGDDGIVRITYEEYRRFLGDINGNSVSQDGWGITVTELQMPDKYNKDRQPDSDGGDGYTLTKHLQPNQKHIEFSFEDTHYRDLKVIKRDSSNTWLLEGAVFTLDSISLDNPSQDTTIHREGKTDANGQFIFKDLPNGTYRITESTPPTGYEPADPNSQIIVVTSMSDRVIEVEFKNAPKEGLLIVKHDAITGKALPGTKFSVRYLGQANASEGTSNSPIEYITGDNGTIYLPDLKAGWYEVRETYVPDGYVIDPEPRLIEITDRHGSYVVEFKNYQDTQLIVLKEDAQTGQPLAGARFTITTAGGNWIADIVTGPQGYATLAGLKPGSYVIQEVEAPAGHLIDPVPQTFEITVGMTQPIFKVFKNDGKNNLFIRKEDEQTRLPLEGAVFQIRYANGEVVKPRVVTGIDGLAQVSDLEPGVYIVEEIEPPQGYILSKEPEQTVVMKAGETVSVLFRNNKQGGIAILKQDAVSGLPLEGAEFTLYDVDNRPLGTYKTGADGYIRVSDLAEGYYFIVETKAPEGYLLDSTKHQVYVEDFKVTLLELTNSEEASLVITKVDAQSSLPLAGAKFGVFSLEGTQQGDVLVTDASGVVHMRNLIPGWYIVKELEAPEGYVLNTEEYRVQIIEGQPVSITVPNTPESGITVHKVDAVSRDPLTGAEFELRTFDGLLVGTYRTNASGSFVTTNVGPGIYYLIETKAPDGYTIGEEQTQVTVREGEKPEITIENHQNTSIEIQKVDAVTGAYLEGAEFEVWTLDLTTLLGSYTTDPSGIVFTEPMPTGNYIIIESKAPAGYIRDEEHHHIEVLYDHPAILKVANKPLTGIMITKLSSVDDQPLVGAKFEIRTAEGNLIGEFTTDTAGDPTVAVEPGVYYVRETKAPDGYLLDETVHRIEVTAGKIVPLVVRDDPAPSLVIFKGDANTGKGIAGAIFKLETIDGDFIGEYTTDAQGEALIRPIAPGYYVATEMSAPEGYILPGTNSKNVTVKVGVINRVEFWDAEKGALVIRLEDEKDGSPLPNGRFELFWAADGEKKGEGVTGNDGSIVWGSLIPGDYLVRQTYAPDGYTMVDIELRATVISGQTTIVVFKDCTSGLVIEKLDKNTNEPLAGARFQVTRNADNIVIGEYVTDVDGLALVSGLEPGMYTVEELVAPANYEIDEASQLVHVKANEIAHATFTDTPYGGVTITTVDRDTNRPIAGIVIEVWRQNGGLVNTWTTDNTGIIQTDKLSNGFYVVKVVHVIDGYIAVTTEQTIEVKDGAAVNVRFEFTASGILQVYGLDVSEKALAGMRVRVTKIDGTIIGSFATDVTGIIKIPGLEAGWYVVTMEKAPDSYTLDGEASQNVEITSNGTAAIKFYFGQTYGVQIRTKVSQTGAMVAGVKYQITRLDGSIVGAYTSDEVGLLYVSLEPGWYVVSQIELPAGYKDYTLCPSRNVEVVAGQPTVIEFVLAQLSSMRVKVVDGSTEAPLYGVSLLLRDSSNTIVDMYTTNNEGYVTLRNTLTDGTYTLTMTTVPDGYTVDSIPKTIEVLNGQTTEIVWKLYTQAGQIQVHLTSSAYNATLDKAAGSNLQGAVFEIYDPFTYVILATIETDSYGVAASAGLPMGRYIIREKSPAPYYGLSGKETEVYIKINNDVVRVEYQAPPLNLKVVHTMTGIANISAGTSGKFIFSAVNNESSDRLDNFYWTLKIPTDAVRGGTLFTGMWSADVNYSISYKTNMSDYRPLAQGLSSASTYQYDLSSLAMSNQGGEYVTEIRFEFGTVPANFTVVTSPIFYGYVMPGIPTGYMVIIRSECGGKYGDAWKTASALWTTNVVGGTTVGAGTTIPGKLPTTGY